VDYQDERDPARRQKTGSHEPVTRTGPDAITWQSKGRTLDGKELPDIKETKMKRVP